MKDGSSDHIMHFQLSDMQVLWSWHHHLHSWTLLSEIRRLAVAALPWMLDLWNSCWTVFVETRFSRWIFSSAVTYAAVVVWLFETTLLNVLRSLSVIVDFRPLFLFTNVVFPWFIYADITLETVALDTHNNVSVVITDASTKHTLTICPLSKSDKSPIFQFFHADCHNTITNALTRALQRINKRKKNIQCCQLKFFQCCQHKQILFFSFLVFPLFCPPPVCNGLKTMTPKIQN
jgi:hypothetical protein